MDGHFIGTVVDGTGGTIGKDNSKLPIQDHTLIVSLTGTDGEGTAAVVPPECNSGIIALLIVVVVAIVLIKGEGTVGTGIDTNLEVVPCLLTNVLHLRPEGQDAAGTYEHRHTVE